MTTADHGMDGVQLFSGSQAGSTAERPPAGPSVFGAPLDGDILDRLDAVAQDDLGSDFFSRGTPAVDDQARAAFRESLAALADIEGRAVGAARAPHASPAVATPTATAMPTAMPTPSPAVDPVAAPVIPPMAAPRATEPQVVAAPHVAAPHLVPPQPSRLSAAERAHVLYGPRLTAAHPDGVTA